MSAMNRISLFVLFSVCSIGVFAQSVNEQSQRRQEIESQIEVIDKQINSSKEQQQATIRNLDLLQQKVTSRKQLLSSIEMQINLLNDSIVNKERAVSILREEYEKVEFSYLQILYKAYPLRNLQTWAIHILASDNLPQAYRRWQYFKNYSRYLNQQASQIKATNDLLAEEIGSLRRLRTEAEGIKGLQQRELTTLNQEERQSRQLVSEMSRQEGMLRSQLQQKQRELDAINRQISSLMAEEERSRLASNTTELEVNRALAANFEQNKGQLPWPLNGVITEPYGQRNHPVLKGIKMPFNNGVDISAHHAEDVRAVFEGVVKQIVLLPAGYNQCILVQHGSYYTFYCKLGSVKVKTGDIVATGDVLGSLSETDSDLTLHFEIWNGTTKQNPEQWLRKK